MRRLNSTVRRQAIVTLWLVALGIQPTPSSDRSTTPSDDRSSHPACRYCGMNRTRFAHSRMLISYADGLAVGACSLHCAALDLALNVRRPPVTTEVGNYPTRELINAETAQWVIGGNKPGVMTHRAKWAFATKQSADDFIREHGGRLTDFAGALKAAYEDMYEDLAMLRQKHRKTDSGAKAPDGI